MFSSRDFLKATLRHRPDLLESAHLSPRDQKILTELKEELTEACSFEN